MRIFGVLVVLLAAGVSHASKTLNYSALEASVATAQRDDGVEVAVSLHLKRSMFTKTSRCFTVSDALQVTLDGRPMTLVFKGGPARPTTISGVAMLPNGCAPPAWRIVSPSRPARSVIEFSLHGGKGRLVVDHLLTQRTLAVPKGAPIKAGGSVALRWMPASDVWNGKYANVQVYRPDAFSKQVLGEYVGGEIRVTLPDMPPGPAQIDVRPQMPIRPRVAECGLGVCTIGAVTSMPVAVTIAR